MKEIGVAGFPYRPPPGNMLALQVVREPMLLRRGGEAENPFVHAHCLQMILLYEPWCNRLHYGT